MNFKKSFKSLLTIRINSSIFLYMQLNELVKSIEEKFLKTSLTRSFAPLKFWWF